MSGGDHELVGPDLAQGIDAKDVPDGGTLVGHAHGEAVLLARRGDGVFAIGATCTHYGAPLADGLLVGDTVRCPWHHACFSLRTGEALRAPALNPVACFDVERRGDRLVVIGKRAPEGPTAKAPAPPSSVVIVGAGAAGNAAAEMLRREGYDGPITMIGADESVPCDRPNLSKDYLAGSAPEEWIPLRPREFYAEQKIALRTGVAVERVEVAARSVTLSSGEKIAYGALLLATGADPVPLTLPGASGGRVHTLRSLADSRAIIERAKDAKRAIVVGAGFIGLEAAASLRARGVHVTVVAPEAVPLARVMGDALGAEIRKIHEEHGVLFHMGAKLTAIDDASVVLDGGTKLPADLVIVGVGVRPAIAIAEAAGLAIDRGVAVDEHLATSANGIYAAGDIARWPDARTGEKIRVEHWVVAERQGQIAAKNMLGQGLRFDAVPFFWSAHYDMTISYVGHAERWDRVDVAGDIAKRDCAVAFRREDKTLAIATIGRDHVSLEAEAAMERDDEEALHRLVP